MSKFKFNAIFGLKPGIDADETYQLWRGEHASYAKNLTLPEVKRYNINRVIHRFGDVKREDVWGFAEFWFDDNEARLAAFATPEGKAAAEDAASHCASRVHLLTEERIIIE